MSHNLSSFYHVLSNILGYPPIQRELHHTIPVVKLNDIFWYCEALSWLTVQSYPAKGYNKHIQSARSFKTNQSLWCILELYRDKYVEITQMNEIDIAFYNRGETLCKNI